VVEHAEELREELREDEYELLARLAQRYYVDERTQEEIAHEFALSRPRCSACWTGRAGPVSSPSTSRRPVAASGAREPAS